MSQPDESSRLLTQEQEITELAEMLYNFRNDLDIKAIKVNIKSFLLANHYRQLDPDQSLPQNPFPIISGGIWVDVDKAYERMLKENWVKVLGK